MSTIAHICGREILDSRGNPTVEAEVTLSSGITAYASVPSGASTGSHEALELRDNDKKRYRGKGVLTAVKHINDLAIPLQSMKIADQEAIDKKMLAIDGTHNKSRLGANAMLAVSLACARAFAKDQGISLCEALIKDGHGSLPVPMMNIINGGAHADNNIDIQEFMILPVGASDFEQALRYGVDVFYALKALLKAKGLSSAVGDEGGFAPDLKSNIQALEMLLQAIEKVGLKAGRDIYLGLDIASSELYHGGYYHLAWEKKRFTSEAFVDYLANWVNNYPIISIEDGMAEEDWDGWQNLTNRLGNKIQLVGDDVFVTNCDILKRGIDHNIANAILIKPNQIGTLTETLQAISMAKKANYGVIISHRSGETEDTAIADLAVASNAGQIKTGSLCRSDRVAKYNQLLRLAQKLGDKVTYAGKHAFPKLFSNHD